MITSKKRLRSSGWISLQHESQLKGRKIILTEVSVITASVDLLLISRYGIAVVELKDLQEPSASDNPSKIVLHGKEDGPWHYVPASGREVPLGGWQTNRNPYIQLRTQRSRITKWLENHPSVPNAIRANASRYVDGWAVILPGFNRNLSRLHLPWNEIGPWFKVLPIQDLARTFYARTSPGVELSEREIQSLVESIGVSKHVDISNVFPKIPPPPPLFSPPPVPGELIDREAERTVLHELLAVDLTD